MSQYRTIRLDFREVVRADTFHLTLAIALAYTMTPETRVIMHVKPVGDIPGEPILVFDTQDATITIDVQDITLSQPASAMDVRAGRYEHSIRFIQGALSDTLYKGVFEIIATPTPLPE